MIKLRVIFLMMLFAGIGFLLSACDFVSQNDREESPRPIETIAAVGEMHTLANRWEFTVNSIEAAHEIPLDPNGRAFFQPRDGNLFVVVDMTVRYTGDNPRGMVFLPLVVTNQDVLPTIKYGNNRTFDIVTLGAQNANDLTNFRFDMDDDPMTGMVVFEVSQAAFDDSGTDLVMSFFQFNHSVLYDLRG